MEWLVSTLGSSAFNGLVGFVGSWVSKREERKALKDEYEYKLASKQMELDEAANERHHALEMADKEVEKAQVEGEIQSDIADAKAFTVSQKTIGKLNGVLRLVRPAITFYLLFMTTILAIGLWIETDGFNALTPSEHKEMLLLVLNQLLSLTSMCVGWWFGSRGGNIK